MRTLCGQPPQGCRLLTDMQHLASPHHPPGRGCWLVARTVNLQHRLWPVIVILWPGVIRVMPLCHVHCCLYCIFYKHRLIDMHRLVHMLSIARVAHPPAKLLGILGGVQDVEALLLLSPALPVLERLRHMLRLPLTGQGRVVNNKLAKDMRAHMRV